MASNQPAAPSDHVPLDNGTVPTLPGSDLLMPIGIATANWDAVERLASGEPAEMITIGIGGVCVGVALAIYVAVHNLGSAVPPWLRWFPIPIAFIPSIICMLLYLRFRKNTKEKLRKERDLWLAAAERAAAQAIEQQWLQHKQQWTPHNIMTALRVGVIGPIISWRTKEQPTFVCDLGLVSSCPYPFTLKVLSGEIATGLERRDVCGRVVPRDIMYPDDAQFRQTVELDPGAIPSPHGIEHGLLPAKKVYLDLECVVECDGMRSHRRHLQVVSWAGVR